MTAALQRRVRPLLPDWNRSLAGLAVGAAAIAVAARYVAVLLVNAPGYGGVPVAPGLATAASTALVAAAALVVAVTDADPLTGIGLLFVGVFGLLSLVSGAAALPAAAATVLGTATVAAVAGRRLDRVAVVAVALLVAALSVGLASGVGGWTGLRPVASTVALLAIASTPAFAATDWGSLSTADWGAVIGGFAAFAVVVAVGRAVPFVTGAVTLTGTGVVGTSLPVVALAAAGAVTTASAASRTRRWVLLAGVALVAFAGVPASLPRALPFALGIAALVREGGR
ncbi:phosphate ABC transporter permease [Haloarcula sp. 1CSR25-25]|uniref:phosphate ABC transporter permease n=1 Tax=Haloarcula sp. 1CSR25-25 TaxID=2862545 RepID=UPI0028938EB4|nr:phosphate ABC transporter permease [Haloarcula sp. 1CSR25-25]MDT3435710.1 phosphate ABC transporter permease [Haloarcula sp. 1CSR25-25]